MDIASAIDDLYSAGWWPSDHEACIRAADGRWYPDEAATTAALARHGWLVRYEHTRDGSVRVAWAGPDRLHGAAAAPDPVSARILVLAALHRAASSAAAPEPGGIG
jgi:hypothetical protein